MRPKKTKKDIKTTQSTTDTKPLRKTVYDEYIEGFGFPSKPISKHFIDRLAERLVEWARDDDDALKVSQFFIQENIHQQTVERWMAKYEHLRKAYDFATTAIGNRRELGGLKRKFDSGIVASTMAHYDKDWKKLAEWRSKLRNQEESHNGPKIVVVERFPETNVVPIKTEDIS